MTSASVRTGAASVLVSSAAVVAAAVLASFRLGFADDVPTLLRVNGPRVLLGAAAGGALALGGALRLAALDLAAGGRGAREARPLRDLEWLALATGAAGGGTLLAAGRTGAAAWAAFAVGAAGGAALLWRGVRALDRPKRWTNLGAAAALALLIGVAAVAGTYVRERRDAVSPVVAWLLGDLSGATFASGLAVLALALSILATAFGAAPGRGAERFRTLALLALGVGVGAAGPLAFIAGMPPRTVRRLARGASLPLVLAASAAAGGATVVAIDTVPRLLVGGYDLPFNVSAAMVAVPVYLGWNRVRLRREAGPAGAPFETAELALLVLLTGVAVWLAATLAGVIRAAT